MSIAWGLETKLMSRPPHCALSPAAGERPIPFYPAKYNVKDYGAKGDGRTDDSGAIQRALDAASAEAKKGKGGVAVFMPDGDYLITKRITIQQSGVVLRGSSVSARRRRCFWS